MSVSYHRTDSFISPGSHAHKSILTDAICHGDLVTRSTDDVLTRSCYRLRSVAHRDANTRYGGGTVKHTRHATRTAYLLGTALLLVACNDTQEATAPAASVDLSKARSINATVTTSVESFDAKGGLGPLAGFTATRKMKAVPKVTGFTLVPPTDPIYCSTSDACEPVSNTAPVMAVVTGDYWGNYDEEMYDDKGNLVRIVATGPGDSPITDVWVWLNGSPQVHLHNTWTAVSGGYRLYNQTITVVRPDASRAVTLSTTISKGYTLVSSNSLGAKFAGFAGNALSKIGCWLAPQAAYAGIPMACTYQAVVFAGSTFVLGAGTVTLFGVTALAPPVTPLAASAYLAGWGLWTASMYDLLHCIDQVRGRPHRTVMLPNYYGF